MKTTLTQETAQRVIEILSDLHDEQVDNPEFAAEIDALCGLLQPQPSLYTVIYQSEDGYFFENTVRAASGEMAKQITEATPGLPAIEGSPITIVEHGQDDVMPAVGVEHPLLVGEYVFFRDPADDLSSGLYRVVTAPAPIDPLDIEPGAEEIYADSVIELVSDAGSALEAYACELSRTR